MNMLRHKPNGIHKIIGIYPGRFQPFGPHHAKVYEYGVSALPVSDLYIATSNSSDTEKSPLTFNEKRQIMEFSGIDGNRIVCCKSPYRPNELTERFDMDRTAFIYLLGSKDYARIKFTKKDGTPGYFRPYTNDAALESGSVCAYVCLAPHFSIESPELPTASEISGTILRMILPKTTPDEFRSIMGWYDRNIHDIIIKRFSGLTPPEEITEQVRDLLSLPKIRSLFENTTTNGDADDGPTFLYSNWHHMEKQTVDISTRLGFTVLSYLLPSEFEFEPHDTLPPKGQPVFSSLYADDESLGKIQKWMDDMRDLAGSIGMLILTDKL